MEDGLIRSFIYRDTEGWWSESYCYDSLNGRVCEVRVVQFNQMYHSDLVTAVTDLSYDARGQLFEAVTHWDSGVSEVDFARSRT